MSGGPGSAGTGKKQKKNEDEADACTQALGSFFPSLSVQHVCLCACVYSLDLWCMKPLYLCPLSCSVPLRFYVNFSYQWFSL